MFREVIKSEFKIGYGIETQMTITVEGFDGRKSPITPAMKHAIIKTLNETNALIHEGLTLPLDDKLK